jgi:NADPH:quinone reductase-like Zn-dependent oxidoreductase
MIWCCASSQRQGQLAARRCARGVSYVDALMIAGQYQAATAFIPGGEAAGVVIETGSGVDTSNLGTVCWFQGVLLRRRWSRPNVLPFYLPL